MKYLLDTDHLSIIQRGTGQDYVNLSTRMAQYPLSDFTTSIVTFHEQFVGRHTYINRAKSREDIIRGYKTMEQLLRDFSLIPVISYDQIAFDVFESLQFRGVRLATMDLRIASIALSKNLTLLTRNVRDFSKVAELKIEDWTVELP